MNQKRRFWDKHSTLSRRAYIAWGLLLFAIKFNIDRVVAHFVFSRAWSITDYFEQSGAWNSADNKAFYLAMGAIAIPFIGIGVALTLRRLRDAGLPLWMVLLFFVPIINLVFFAALSAIPSRNVPSDAVRASSRFKTFLDRAIPMEPTGSAIAAVFLIIILTILGTLFSTSFLQEYGGGLFIGMPFCLGLISTLIHGYHGRRTFEECVRVSIYAVVLGGIALLLVAIEGVICLLMAAIPAIFLAGFGGIVGYAILSATRWKEEAPKLFCTVLVAVPLLCTFENNNFVQAPLLEIKTAIEIKASPSAVWNNVVSFRELPPPKELLFRTGIAYPVCAEIRGSGVGAIRHCVFSTGPFVEPIEVWDEPNRLQFSVTENPEPMHEWTPYREIHPPHLNGFFISERGQFLLRHLPGNRTMLEGTTWYRQHLRPVWYWKIWSDFIIHRIHLRVLNHIKHLSEKDQTNNGYEASKSTD